MSQVCQEFRSSHTKKIVRILSVRDDNGKQVIFWSDIEREFRGAESIRQEGTSVVFLKNAANEPLLPERIEPHPGAVLDVIVGSHALENSLSWIEKKFTCDASTYYALGVSYDKGGGGPTDPALALENYIHAAELDHAEARTKVGIMYRDGYGVEQNYPKAYEWFFKNAVEGAPGSQVELGDMFYSGHGVEKNHYTAKDWYQKAADQGHARGQYMLGYLYYAGEGVDRSLNNARDWIDKAAQQGYEAAKKFQPTLYPSPPPSSECCTIL